MTDKRNTTTTDEMPQLSDDDLEDLKGGASELLSKVGDGDFRRRVGLAFLRP